MADHPPVIDSGKDKRSQRGRLFARFRKAIGKINTWTVSWARTFNDFNFLWSVYKFKTTFLWNNSWTIAWCHVSIVNAEAWCCRTRTFAASIPPDTLLRLSFQLFRNKCNTVVSPMHQHWRYDNFALNHLYYQMCKNGKIFHISIIVISRSQFEQIETSSRTCST